MDEVVKSSAAARTLGTRLGMVAERLAYRAYREQWYRKLA